MQDINAGHIELLSMPDAQIGLRGIVNKLETKRGQVITLSIDHAPDAVILSDGIELRPQTEFDRHRVNATSVLCRHS